MKRRRPLWKHLNLFKKVQEGRKKGRKRVHGLNQQGSNLYRSGWWHTVNLVKIIFQHDHAAASKISVRRWRWLQMHVDDTGLLLLMRPALKLLQPGFLAWWLFVVKDDDVGLSTWRHAWDASTWRRRYTRRRHHWTAAGHRWHRAAHTSKLCSNQDAFLDGVGMKAQCPVDLYNCWERLVSFLSVSYLQCNTCIKPDHHDDA